jgi:hypothetical protein
LAWQNGKKGKKSHDILLMLPLYIIYTFIIHD